MNYILIDGSYYCFYRYYALLNWWKMAHADEKLDVPFDNEKFVDKFKSTFFEKIKEIPKKLKIKDVKFIVAKDCPRTDIWRNRYSEEYKATRVYDDTFMGGPFFKLAYEELFPSMQDIKIIYNNNLEADDSIAIATKCIHELNNDANIYIIASDTDYLQLLKPNLFIYTLKYKEIKESKTYHGDPVKYLFCKILMGDKIDNIKSAFDKCGPKMADRCWLDEEYFREKLKNEDYEKRYNLNKRLISFDEIPKELVKDFINNNLNKLK
tara:strand:+ start:947 stop:1744 length:798 start_codon:yes stop_codon:yes gene_type:complete